jgi:hypothetical protein
MFESSLLTALKSDNDLVRLISKYNGEPSIFCEAVPEGVALPYITFSISRYEADSLAVDKFNIYVDFWDRSPSSANARLASQRIEFILDCKTLQHDRYDSIRIYHSSGTNVPELNPEEIHYNLQFMARAGRKAWCEQL